MNKGICILPMAPVRAKPSDRSEMINQLLFGDVVSIKDRYKSWLFLETAHDGYAGWVDDKQLSMLTPAFSEKMEKENPVFLATAFVKTGNSRGNSLVLTMGSRLPLFDGTGFQLLDERYLLPESITVLTGKQPAETVAETAKMYLGSPFLWGGRSYFGNDCSGFTQIVYRMCGYNLLRDASQQAERGTLVSFVEEALPGDIAFFEDEEGNINHVGILLNNRHIIHSSGKVRIDTLDHEGIFNERVKKYTHKLRFIKRVLP